MSKTLGAFLHYTAIAIAIICAPASAHSQETDVTITIFPSTPNRVHVNGKMVQRIEVSSAHGLAFYSLEHSGIRGFAERFTNVMAQGEAGLNLPVRMVAPGVFDTGTDPKSWSYDVDLSALNNVATQLSWLDGDHGVLMIDDLLPRGKGLKARVRIQVPDGWSIFAAQPETNPGEFDFDNVEKIALFVGRGWRVTNLSLKDSPVRVLLRDDWHFSDAEAASLINEISFQYLRVIGSLNKNRYQIGIHKLPGTVASGTWTANTVGPNIVIASSDMPFKTQSLQRLHEQLRHEMFHLWIPNGVDLAGNYDWFYEGFALYQSLKMGVAVNRIRFEDYLDTLSRAYDIDRSDNSRLSLINASKVRWREQNNTVIYARGMLVAFLCDLALQHESKGKKSSDAVVREVYTKYRQPSQPQDGNAAVLSILRAHQELGPIVDRYVSGTDGIDWISYLRLAGLEATNVHGATRLTVIAKPSGRQKNLLDKLGYNSWRELSKGNK